jgi:hypothetical protein
MRFNLTVTLENVAQQPGLQVGIPNCRGYRAPSDGGSSGNPPAGVRCMKTVVSPGRRQGSAWG